MSGEIEFNCESWRDDQHHRSVGQHMRKPACVRKDKDSHFCSCAELLQLVNVIRKIDLAIMHSLLLNQHQITLYYLLLRFETCFFLAPPHLPKHVPSWDDLSRRSRGLLVDIGGSCFWFWTIGSKWNFDIDDDDDDDDDDADAGAGAGVLVMLVLVLVVVGVGKLIWWNMRCTRIIRSQMQRCLKSEAGELVRSRTDRLQTGACLTQFPQNARDWCVNTKKRTCWVSLCLYHFNWSSKVTDFIQYPISNSNWLNIQISNWILAEFCWIYLHLPGACLLRPCEPLSTSASSSAGARFRTVSVPALPGWEAGRFHSFAFDLGRGCAAH